MTCLLDPIIYNNLQVSGEKTVSSGVLGHWQAETAFSQQACLQVVREAARVREGYSVRSMERRMVPSPRRPSWSSKPRVGEGKVKTSEQGHKGKCYKLL